MSKNVDAAPTATVAVSTTTKWKKIKTKMWKYRGFYLMFLPVFIFALFFFYLPMIGIRYAFYDYNGLKEATFVGIKHFKTMFTDPFKSKDFFNAVLNTVEISVFKLLLTTGFAVIVSIFLNEMINIHFKKVIQTIIYLPHFLSWVVTASLFSLILAPNSHGLINTFLLNIGVIKSADEYIYFLGSSAWWRPIYFLINLWKETGWQTVIFMATLSGINPELYEAASIDGAGRFQKMRYLTFPAIRNTILTVIILNLAKIMNLFESVWVLQNNAVIQTSQVLETYIYNQTFNSGRIPNYGYTAAVGLFKSLIGMVLVLVCNHWSKKVREGRGIV
ncbi:MAG: ABC transporter permease subunit [Lachnospiraceae bacterium]|nr:ABC transporter permease subunit [Lachnospiraceae bacterium]